MPKVSVVVPVYRVEKYIDRCLVSLTHQTLKEIEIICICGVNDPSHKIIQKRQSEDERIILIEKENEGVSNSRNEGIKSATGEYIAFVDADDWVERYAFENLYYIIKANHADILVFGMYPNVEPRGAKRGIFGYFTKENAIFVKHSMTALFYQHGSRPYIGNKMYLRNFLIENNIYFDELLKIGEDQLFQFMAFSKADIVCYVREKFYHYDIARSESAMNCGDKKDEVREANLLLLHRIMSWKEQALSKKYDCDFVWWILQDYTGWIAGLRKEEQVQYADKLMKELMKCESDRYIKKMPCMYQRMYEFVQMCSRGKCRDICYSSREADHYMELQTRPVKKAMWLRRRPVRRLYEAISFHEIRHLAVRIWIWLGMKY